MALIGNEAALRARIDRIRGSGVTDINAAILVDDSETYERTFEILPSFN